MPVCVTAVLCFMYLTVPLCQLRLYGFVTLCEWVCMAVVCVCVCVCEVCFIAQWSNEPFGPCILKMYIS